MSTNTTELENDGETYHRKEGKMAIVMTGAGVTKKRTAGTATLRGVSKGNGHLIAAASWLLGVVILLESDTASHSGSFGSSNTKDFNLEAAGIRAATMSGSYVPNKSFHGTIAYFNGDTESFTSTYDTDYESAPNMNLVAGTYPGVRADNHTVTVTVDSAGTLSGHSSDECTFAGTLSPRAKGNVFHHAVTFGGGICSHGTETVAGVTFYDAATNRLYSAALNNARTNSLIFLGTKR